MHRIYPYGSHIYMFAGRILPIWDLYGSYMGKQSLYRAHVGPEWDKCPDSAHMGHIYTCLLGQLLFRRNRSALVHDLLINHILSGVSA